KGLRKKGEAAGRRCRDLDRALKVLSKAIRGVAARMEATSLPSDGRTLEQVVNEQVTEMVLDGPHGLRALREKVFATEETMEEMGGAEMQNREAIEGLIEQDKGRLEAAVYTGQHAHSLAEALGSRVASLEAWSRDRIQQNEKRLGLLECAITERGSPASGNSERGPALDHKELQIEGEGVGPERNGSISNKGSHPWKLSTCHKGEAGEPGTRGAGRKRGGARARRGGQGVAGRETLSGRQCHEQGGAAVDGYRGREDPPGVDFSSPGQLALAFAIGAGIASPPPGLARSSRDTRIKPRGFHQAKGNSAEGFPGREGGGGAKGSLSFPAEASFFSEAQDSQMEEYEGGEKEEEEQEQQRERKADRGLEKEELLLDIRLPHSGWGEGRREEERRGDSVEGGEGQGDCKHGSW
ncbi:unnamed protein product, partial [Discosporangium mesarthrocarpum]